MRLALVGCGYVADYYIATLNNYPQLELAGVFDRDEERAIRCSQVYKTRKYNVLNDLLEDQSISIVVNLTNIREHYAMTKACLEAGKHVYSEKPLASNFAEAKEIVDIAKKKSLHLACAPASLLGETAQTVWKMLRNGAIGDVWLAYAELDDDAVHLGNYHNWHSSSGTPWPFQDEFEMGCTQEHAAYYLGWLTTFFGPARQVNAFSACLVPDKIGENAATHLGDDFSVSCITFSSGAVARLTCSVLAPKDHSLTIIGSEGILTVEDCWKNESPVSIQKRSTYVRNSFTYSYLSNKVSMSLERPEEEGNRVRYNFMAHDMDFARGIAELADAILHYRTPRLSAEHALHIVEIISCITKHTPSPYEITTSFSAVDPMPWVKD